MSIKPKTIVERPPSPPTRVLLYNGSGRTLTVEPGFLRLRVDGGYRINMGLYGYLEETIEFVEAWLEMLKAQR